MSNSKMVDYLMPWPGHWLVDYVTLAILGGGLGRVFDLFILGYGTGAEGLSPFMVAGALAFPLYYWDARNRKRMERREAWRKIWKAVGVTLLVLVVTLTAVTVLSAANLKLLAFMFGIY